MIKEKKGSILEVYHHLDISEMKTIKDILYLIKKCHI